MFKEPVAWGKGGQVMDAFGISDNGQYSFYQGQDHSLRKKFQPWLVSLHSTKAIWLDPNYIQSRTIQKARTCADNSGQGKVWLP